MLCGKYLFCLHIVLVQAGVREHSFSHFLIKGLMGYEGVKFYLVASEKDSLNYNI